MLCLWSHIDPRPKFPGQLEPLALLSGQSALPTQFSTQDLLRCAASGCSRQVFLSEGLGAMLPSEWGSGSHLGRTAKAHFRHLPNSPQWEDSPPWSGGVRSHNLHQERPRLSSCAWVGTDQIPESAKLPRGSPVSEAVLFPRRLPAQTPPPTRPCR